MIQHKQSKKIKGSRKKAREEIIERLQLKFPTWFEGKTDREIITLVSSFKSTGMEDDEFPAYCIRYEAEREQFLNNAI